MPPKTKKLNTVVEVERAARVLLSDRGLDFSNGEYVPVPRTHEIAVQGCAGLAIMYHDVKGTETDFYRFRFLEQPLPTDWDKLTGREQAERRYSQPAGTTPRAYFPKNFPFTKFFSKPPHDRELTITEGEFKADAAAKHGIACIGLGGVWNYLVKTKDGGRELLPELARLPWAGMRVCVCFDSDIVTNTEVVRARDGLCERLEDLGARLFVRQLPHLKNVPKTGLDDFLLREGKKRWEALPLDRWYGPGVPELVMQPKDDFLKHEYAEREEILKSSAACLLRHPSIVQIHAFRGVGKTNLAMKLAGALASKGGEFFRWRTVRAMRVLYVEGEQAGADVQQLVTLQAKDAPSENLHVMTLEDQPNFNIPKIVTPQGRAAIERALEKQDIKVLFLDSLSTLANVAMNDEENQLALGDWFVRLRTGLRVTVIYLQHDGKTGNQRGHSKHEDWIDLSIHLTWAEGYHGAEGLRADFHIDKARQPIADGRDMRLSFGTALKDPTRSEWVHTEISKEDKKQDGLWTAITMLVMRKPEMSVREMERELRAQGQTGRNETFQKIRKQVEEKLRAQGDAVNKAAKGKVPKY